MPRLPLTQADLSGKTCESPDCTHEGEEPLFIHGRCHLSAALDVSYLNGVLTMVCAVCKRLVATFAVAKGPVQ